MLKKYYICKMSTKELSKVRLQRPVVRLKHLHGNEGVLIRRYRRYYYGDTIAIRLDNGREYFAPASEFMPA